MNALRVISIVESENLMETNAHRLSDPRETGAVSSANLQDAAHILGTSQSSLVKKSTHAKSSKRATTDKPSDKSKSMTLSKSATEKAGNASKSQTLQTSKPSTGKLNKKNTAAVTPGIADNHAEFLRNHSDLQSFLHGASPAQVAQVEMIQRVFARMDIDGDSLLSLSDVRTYFQQIGRYSSDADTRRWIRDRDVDQDGAVSLPEVQKQQDPISLSTNKCSLQ